MMSFFPFFKMLLQKGLLFFICALVSSCVTYVYPKGGWAEPLDLELHNASLKGIVVKVTCNDDGSSLQSSDSSAGGACFLIRRSIKNLGATVLDLTKGSKSENDKGTNVEAEREVSDGAQQSGGLEGLSENVVPDVLVGYKDAPSHSGSCGWSWIPMIATGFLYPCLAETHAQATLTISTARSHWRSSSSLEVTVRKYFGTGALTLLLSDMGRPLSRTAYQRQLSDNFVSFVQSKVYTAAMIEGGAF